MTGTIICAMRRSGQVLALAGLTFLVVASGYSPGELARLASAGRSALPMTAQEIAEQIPQATTCEYCVAPIEKSFTADGGDGSITVAASAGCGWTAETGDSFITITSGSTGSGGGAVTFSVAPNTGSGRRVGTITVAGQTVTVLQGIAFDDVPSDHAFYTEIGKLSARGITLGCDGSNYCPDLAVTRDQMAAFIIRALGELNPPQPATQRFADVPPTNPFYAFIDRLAELGITLGCDANNYCPSDPVLRDQMAAFIIRALGEIDPPAPGTQRFADVPPTNPFYAFIDRLAELGITLGCDANNYCPSQVVTRGQMAAFLIRAFDAGFNGPPAVSAGADQAITLPSAARLTGFVSDDGRPTCALTLLWSQVSGPGAVTFSDPDSETTMASFNQPGTYVLRLMASDFQTASTDDLTITVNPIDPSNQPPSANAGPDQTVTLPETSVLNGDVNDDGAPSGGGLTASWSLVSGPGTVVFSNASAAATTASFSAAGNYVLRLTASDSILTASDDVEITVNADPTPPPPDPATIAPPIDPTVTTTIGAATEFLYTGANPIQTGVAPGTIDPVRAAVLRGRVLNRGGAPLPLVKITVLNHPELGQTFTRADGMFDMAVNGGRLLTIRYEKPGFLEVQRQERVPWQDYCPVADVVMIGHDSRVTHIDLSASIPIQVARANPVTDRDGTRQATLLFRQGTTANMVLPGGATVPLVNLHVRATEYTVGPNGQAAMPGDLPATSAYTYAVEFNADEAVAAGARNVIFSQPVISYMENFLNLPAGTVVPAGSYNRVESEWAPEDNGRVVRVLSITSGVASLDVTGSGQPASDSEYAALGITPAERQQMATLYQAGQSLWRVPIPHFTEPWDFNFAGSPDPGADSPPGGADGPDQPEDSCEESGSIIECQNQVLRESIPVTGTPFTLNYRSNRVPAAGKTLDISVSGATVPPGLKRIELIIFIAGRRITEVFPPAPNQSFSFTWDGRDIYNRVVQGSQPVTVRIGYVYDGFYQLAEDTARAFARYPRLPITQARSARTELVLFQQFEEELFNQDTRSSDLGAWTLDVHHAYEPPGQVLHLGDGRRRSAAGLPQTISTVAGGGSELCGHTQPCGDGGPAIGATIDAQGIAIDAQGNLYIADTFRDKIRKVDTSGIITTIAGTGVRGFGGDGGPATQARFNFPTDVEIDGQGNIYIVDMSNHRIRKIDPSGIITTIAGTGARDFGGDGGPAVLARLNGPRAIALAPDGTLFIADFGNSRIRQISPDGIINTTVVSTPGNEIIEPSDVVLDREGNLFYTSTRDVRVRRLSPDGRITTVAGGGSSRADGIPATSASVQPNGLAVDDEGNLYITDAFARRIRRVDPRGIITTVAGGGAFTLENTRDGLPATGAAIVPQYIVVDEQNNLIYSDRLTSSGLPSINRIRKIGSALPQFTAETSTVASEDGNQLYVFDGTGRHLLTLNALTGATVYTFGYDPAGRLATITDGDTNVTAIERNTSGQPTAIIAPFGQRTTLTLDPNGYLASIANPAGEAYRMTYTSDGLLRTFTDPEDNVSTITYDARGLLDREDNPAGGFFDLSRVDAVTNYTVSLTTALTRTTAYQVERLATGEQRQVTTSPDGLQTRATEANNGSRALLDPDGMLTTLVPGPDPRWGLQSPTDASLTQTTPSGLTNSSTNTRAVTLANPLDPLSLVTLTSTLSINGRNYVSTYTAASRSFAISTPQSRQATRTIDVQDRITDEQFANLEPVKYIYDARGRLKESTVGTGPQARQAILTYNSGGYIETVTDPMGRTLSLTYDDAGRVRQQNLPGSRSVNYTHDANGNFASITPPGRPAHNFTYNSAGLIASYTPPNIGAGTGQIIYTYNLDRQLSRITRSDTRTLDFGYNSAGRLDTLTVPGGQYLYTYNAATGNTASISAPGGSILSYSYDGLLLTGTTWAGPVSGSVTRSYNNDFRLASLSVNGSNTINLQYDNDGLLTSAGSLTLTRDTQNGLITGSSLGSVTDTRGYNGFAEITSYSAAHSGTNIYSAQYTRDKLGRITEKTETIGGVTDIYIYQYDPAGRLSSVQKNGATAAIYTYDDNGNRLSYTGTGPAVTGVYDDQDRMSQYGATTYTYSDDGELMNKTTGGQTTAYGYDVVGNLRTVTLADNTEIEYVIDGRNRRIGKRVNGTLVQGFLYRDQHSPVAELDGGNNVVSHFVYGSRDNVPDYMIKGGDSYRIITDHLGSPRLVVNTATGAIAQRMDYDEFGVVVMDTNPGFQPFGFAGGIYDRHTRLVRFGARDYDAETGRWTIKDPILLEGGLNVYAYVENDPVNLSDSTGLQPNPARVRKAVEACRRAAARIRRQWAREDAARKAAEQGKIGGEGMVPAGEKPGSWRRFIEETADTIVDELPNILDAFLPPVIYIPPQPRDIT